MFKLLLLRKILFGLLFLSGITLLASSCRNHKESVPVRSAITLTAADTVQAPSLKAFTYYYYGRRYLNAHNYDDALQCFSQAADIFGEKLLMASYANALRNMGRAHLLSSRPDSALHYYLRAQGAVADFDPNLFMDISTELSIICRDVDNWEEAKQQMLQYRRNSATDELPMRRSSMVGMYLIKDDFLRGREHALSALQDGELKVKDYRQFASEYQELYAEWCKMNDNQQAFDRDIKDKYNNEVLKNENQRIKNELLSLTVWRLSAGYGVVLLVAIGFVTFYLYKRNVQRRIGNLLARLNENERQLNEGKLDSEEKRQQLLQENRELSCRIEKLSVRQKDKDELNSYLQRQNASYLKELKGYQEIHSLLPVERMLALNRLCRMRDQPVYGLVDSDEEWSELFAVIDTFYGDMSEKLSDYELGMQERRICYLIRAGLTNSMVATITNVTEGAITKSKQRMKVKFSLSTGDSFNAFIRKL
ncbi:tetratricopeptide repeat protein [Bacteroides sp. UBA939]|uniref:tetratricopeptide repeat protein n=1 Tax=Bacteroides sp. UBA939 TaxID=1946092 RepID=UPI0025C24959|nr:tetratricopeptide repeat protein [Bacteroides sp. UBA939]